MTNKKKPIKKNINKQPKATAAQKLVLPIGDIIKLKVYQMGTETKYRCRVHGVFDYESNERYNSFEEASFAGVALAQKLLEEAQQDLIKYLTKQNQNES